MLVWSPGALVEADTADEIARRIAELEEELKGVREGIAEIEGSVEANMEVLIATETEVDIARHSLTQVNVDLEAARVRLILSEEEVAAGERRLAAVENRIATLELQLSTIRSEIVEKTHSLERRAVDLYMDFFSAGRWAVLQQENMVDLTLGRVYGGDLLVAADQELRDLHALDRDREDKEALLDVERVAASDQLANLDSQREVRVDELWEVERLRLEASSQLAVVEELVTGVQVQINAFRADKEGLEKDAAELAKEITYRKVLLERALRPGRMVWPADGLITAGFGWRNHPILNRRLFHNGLDLGAPTGTPIRSAAEGRVILAQGWGGYGNAVVVQHGGDVTSIYAHLSRFGTSVGRNVAEGEVIGFVGCTGLCTGPHLHFEVREGGGPVDPLKYLQG
jgi:murein DD-endopeptidase MepM/ murein hydrolase activator NlpD